jgi:biotin transporter BioY
VKEPSTGRVIGVVVGFCVSFGATFWLLSICSETHGTNRLGLLSAIVCTFGALLYFWAMGFAYVVHELNWSYRACRYAGCACFVPGSLRFLSHARPRAIMDFLLCQAALASYIARKVGFPEMSDEETAAPEPLPTMFPK